MIKRVRPSPQVTAAAVLTVLFVSTIRAGFDVSIATSDLSNQSDSTITSDQNQACTSTTTSAISADRCLDQCHNLFVAGEMPMSEAPSRAWACCNCEGLFCNQTVREETHQPTNHTAAMEHQGNIKACRWSIFAIDALLASLNDSACDEAHEAEFIPDPRWDKYRLGDFFKGFGKFGKRWNTREPEFQGSLMDDYHKESIKNNVTYGNYDIMYKVVKDRLAKIPSHELPLPNTLVIHLRLGDVVDKGVDTVRDFLLEQKYYFRWDEEKKGPWSRQKKQ
jgi:hypothetical protein